MKIVPRKAVAFWIVAYTLCIVMVGTNIPAPLYSLYSHAWHFSSGVVTLLFATYAFVLVPSSLLFGQLSDRFGRKRLLISGVLTAAVSTIILGLAEGLWMLLLGRAIQGLCVGMLSGSAIATLTELRADNRKEASLVASVAIAVGTATGPLLSGIVAQYAPYPMHLSYDIHLLLLLPAIVGIVVSEESIRRTRRTNQLHLPSIPPRIRFRFLTATFTGVIVWAVAGFFMVVAPTFVTSLVGVHNVVIAGIVVFLMLGSSTVMQILLKRVPLGVSIFTGFALLSGGIVCILLSIPSHSLWLLLLSTVVAGAGHGPGASASLSMVTEVAPIDSKADIVSSYYAIAYLGVSVPVLGLGFVAEWIGMYTGICIFSVAIIAGILTLCRFVLLALKESSVMAIS